MCWHRSHRCTRNILIFFLSHVFISGRIYLRFQYAVHQHVGICGVSYIVGFNFLISQSRRSFVELQVLMCQGLFNGKGKFMHVCRHMKLSSLCTYEGSNVSTRHQNLNGKYFELAAGCRLHKEFVLYLKNFLNHEMSL